MKKFLLIFKRIFTKLKYYVLRHDKSEIFKLKKKFFSKYERKNNTKI